MKYQKIGLSNVSHISLVIAAISFGAFSAGWNFTYKSHFKGLGRCDDIAIADFNGDKRNDVVYSTGHVFLNKGGNPPSWEHVSGVFDESMGMWVGDLDNDGDMDIFAPKKDGTGYFVENADGKGKSWNKHAIFNMPEKLAEETRCVDINKDGKDDLAVMLRSGGPLYLLIQPSNAKSSWPSYKVGTASGDEGAVDFGDIDNDGDIDLFGQGYWYENDGNPAKADWKRHAHGGKAHKQRLGDINKDGKLDIIDGGRILFGPDFSNSKSMGPVPSGIYLHGLMPVDFDTDGDLDVMVGSFPWSGNSAPPVTIFENADGKGGSWKRHALSTGGAGHNAWCADLNGDKRPDIVGKHFDKNQSSFDVWYNTLTTAVSVAERRLKPVQKSALPYKYVTLNGRIASVYTYIRIAAPLIKVGHSEKAILKQSF